MTTDAAAPFHQAVAIEHGMDGAFGRNGDAGEPADQTLADLARTPTGVLMLHVQDVVLHLKGEFIGVAIGTSAPVGQPLHLCLAKTPSSPEINSLHNFLKPPICYDCSLCSAFSASGWEQSSGFSITAGLARGEPRTSSAAQCTQASKPAAQTGRPR